MSKKQIKKIIFMGVGCALLLIVGTIYSLLYNDGRWVKNMDMSEYVFSYKDIPMLVIGALIALYAIYIVIICFKNVFSKNSREKRYSRTISLKVNFLISQKMSFFKKINVRHNQKPTRQVLNYYLQLSGLWQQVCFPVMLSGVQYLC